MRTPRVACSWCGNGPKGSTDTRETAPCGDCRAYGLRLVAASEEPADQLRRAEIRIGKARSDFKAAKKELRKAEKYAKRAGLWS